MITYSSKLWQQLYSKYIEQYAKKICSRNTNNTLVFLTILENTSAYSATNIDLFYYKILVRRTYMRLRRQKNTLNDNNTIEFLKAAISDLTGNLTLLDTKISIIMATVGVILGLVVACKSNILRAYYFYANNYCLKSIFLLLSLAYAVTIIITFIYGIKCILIRFGKSKASSLWFFDTESYGGISERKYINKVKRMSNETILNNLSIEVYKLNTINNRKMRSGKTTIILFSLSCAIIAILMLMVGISYLVVE